MALLTAFQPPVAAQLHLLNRMQQADRIVLLTKAQFTPKNKPPGYQEGKKTGQQHAFMGGHHGQTLLTVPVSNKRLPIKDTLLAQGDWRKGFIATLEHTYSKAPYCSNMLSEVKDLIDTDNLCELNTASTMIAAYIIGCSHKVDLDTSFETTSTKGDWMLELCQEAKADKYICGGPSMDYLNLEDWSATGVQVIEQKWTCPTYKQVWKQFQPNLSWWDAYAHLGADGLRDLLA